jgi:arylsulfatase A-like enzyme
VSQMDFIASFSSLIGKPVPQGDAPDSENLIQAFLGKSVKGRTSFVEQGGPLSVVKDGWKYISPSGGAPFMKDVGIESGNLPTAQLYHLTEDLGEKNNLAGKYPERVKELSELLEQIKQKK